MSSLFKSAPAKRRAPKKSESLISRSFRWAAALLTLAILSASLFVPASTGAVGGAVHDALTDLLGPAAFLLPLWAAFVLLRVWRAEEPGGVLTAGLGGTLVLLGAATLGGVAGLAAGKASWGGAVGTRLALLSGGALGRFGTVSAALASLALGAQILFHIRWGEVLKAFAAHAASDFAAWQSGRTELKAAAAGAKKREKDAEAKTEPRIAPMPETAKSKDAPAPVTEPQPVRKEASAPGGLPPIIEAPKPAAPKKKAAAGEPAVPAEPGKAAYTLPSLDLLNPKKEGAGVGRPSEAEIRDAVSNLEGVFKSFEIDARVTGISPGPVITRYEVSPGSGVTVNSIVARADDIALTMKARGIRLIAPIPGKAAIGIEIPNAKGAFVGMREILESPAMAGNDAPLLFALGLSSDGTPLAADLQTMPHILVAGATNSGKSVMVHSLIGSILFRMPPDKVKMVLIDPKRIELSFYDGIPHLYDPKTQPDKVEVITDAKAAAGALKGLVRVMEDRLEKYKARRVQNIAQYNREAAAKGEKQDYYIVVVIDELADLMTVAGDIVEDSIRRLTQMARAIGIHMVIATQRPSVDVLTGVIKANLPSRIAMRVATKVDSKVIIDQNGADALLGKGDALYMTPGQDPSRIQGAFVSTAELGALVDYLKTQGKPDYRLIDVIAGPAGAEDLAQFGVELLEFTQALKLVLERRRVSQDLLKAQFGSSARATNLLSLLEIKGFINKPEGSNKWNIHFEKIEDYLTKNFPQVDLNKPGI
ncbi:MAG: DNA segregation ATPase FtsK/SpoIIIE, S-DNA-T family [Elusimicrobia bacterium]|nr:MAG: DNA segregation ATPase FtsK/SpoIIIE, S-DNA-T family [Elusimicrobiota bacterium]